MFKVGDIVLYINNSDKNLKGTEPLKSFIGKTLKIKYLIGNNYMAYDIDNSSIYHEVYPYEIVKKPCVSHLPKWW